MERVRVSQPAEMYWRMGTRPAAFDVSSWAMVRSGHATRIRRRTHGEESLRFFMAFGSQHHNADAALRKYSMRSFEAHDRRGVGRTLALGRKLSQASVVGCFEVLANSRW